jgi:hypothetical protein
VDYCNGLFSAELSWDDGSVSTKNPPIRYVLANEILGYWNAQIDRLDTGQTGISFSTTGYKWEGGQSGVYSSVGGCSAPVLYGLYGSVSGRWIFRNINCDSIISAPYNISWTPNPLYPINNLRKDRTPSARQKKLTITDSTGTIFTQEYEEKPTGFAYTCRSNTPNC